MIGASQVLRAFAAFASARFAADHRRAVFHLGEGVGWLEDDAQLAKEAAAAGVLAALERAVHELAAAAGAEHQRRDARAVGGRIARLRARQTVAVAAPKRRRRRGA